MQRDLHKLNLGFNLL